MHHPDPTHEHKFSRDSAFSGKWEVMKTQKKARVPDCSRKDPPEVPLVAQNTLCTVLL